MKNKILIAAAAAAGAAFITYLVRRSRNSHSVPRPIPVPRRHHLTNVFAQAKKHSD